LKHKLKATRKDFSLRVLIVLLALLALPAAWRWTPLGEWINFETITAWQQSVKGDPAAPYLVAAAYVLGSLVFFPVTILTVATVLTFGPAAGNTYALVGWLLSASVGYGIGRVLGRELLHKMAGPRLDRLIRQAELHGIVAVLTMRLLPVAPFTLVNLFVGASYIRFRDFIFASMLGRIPGIVALTLVGVQFENALRAPGVRNFALLGLIVLLALLALVWLSRRAESGAASHRYSSKP
jgi:phospholipase D1/2